MEFEVVVMPGTNLSDQSHHLSESGESLPEADRIAPEIEKCTIRAHRVIVAARCDWFRRALLSGMREAIDK